MVVGFKCHGDVIPDGVSVVVEGVTWSKMCGSWLTEDYVTVTETVNSLWCKISRKFFLESLV